MLKTKYLSPVVLSAVGALQLFCHAQAPAPDSAPPATPEPPPALVPAVAPATEAGNTLTGKITAVSLYKGSATVTRLVEIPEGEQKAMEIIVSPLPAGTQPSSVFADHAGGVEIHSVSCRTRPPDDLAKLEGSVADLDNRIKALQRKISNATNEQALRRIRQQYLRGLEGFVAPATAQEMTHGVLQADELQKITQMHFKEYESASQEILKLEFEVGEDREKLETLQTEREKLAQGPPVTYDAVVYLKKTAPGAAKFNINYLVSDCGWSPVYNMKGDAAKNQIAIEFYALIHQVSGEDWSNVHLILSTASPTVSAYNPRLTPLYVRMAQGAQNQPALSAQQYEKALASRGQANSLQGQGVTLDAAAAANFDANNSAASVQLIELSERLSELRRLSSNKPEEDLSIQYPVEQAVSVVSRRDPQMVPVSRQSSPADFRYVAVPVLTNSVFREAKFTNTFDHDFLGGQVNVYLDSEFIGRTDIPTMPRGRDITIGFGVDGQLRARRTLVDRQELVQGGNQKVEFTTEIVFDNYKEKPVTIQVRERTPYMEDTASLRVALGEMTHPLSEDADYQRFEKPKGILLWAMPVAVGAGTKATTLRFEYSLEFDKNVKLQEISSEQKGRIREEFINELKTQRMEKAN